jgi:hypothetical protein
MKKTILLPVLLFLFAAVLAKAQPSSPDGTIPGTWKGISICQVKDSPCHDENVIYHISPIQGTDSFNIAANKVINGKEIEMGVIGCKLDRANHRLVSSAGNSVWTLNFKDKELDGNLVFNGTLYRIVKLTKQP